MAKNQVTIEIKGIEELIKTLDSLEPDMRIKAARSSMRLVAQKMQSNMERLVPRGKTGNLASNLKHSVKMFPEKNAVVAFGRVKYSREKGGGNHAHLLEYGHKLVKGRYARTTIGSVSYTHLTLPTKRIV